MRLHPRVKRQFRQILAIGIIWFVFSLMYVFLEVGLLGGSTEYPSTGNKYVFQNSLIYTTIGSFMLGLLQGCFEVFFFKRRFTHMPFWKKILVKSTFYISFLILFFALLTLFVNSSYLDTSIFDPKVWESLEQFMKSFAFWSIIIYGGLILDLSLFYLEISEYIGSGVLYNYSFGTYHKPKRETRIFMFLDMKGSTAIAERLGHEKYFNLLREYYADMTNAILETAGQIYQYVGDEIVVSWTKKEGIYQNNCIRCFEKNVRIFEANRAKYLDRFGLVPEFKAGYHIGEVTVGEIGIIKKDIIYTGDVLNTAARIQAECNTYGAKALISGTLLNELQKEDPIAFDPIGKLILRGKTAPIQLFSVIFDSKKNRVLEF